MQRIKLKNNEILQLKCIINICSEGILNSDHFEIGKMNTVRISNISDFYENIKTKDMIMDLGSALWIKENEFTEIFRILSDLLADFRAGSIKGMPELLNIDLELAIPEQGRMKLPPYGHCRNCILKNYCESDIAGQKTDTSEGTNKKSAGLTGCY